LLLYSQANQITGYRLDGWSLIPGRYREFFLFHCNKNSLGPTQTIQWVPGVKPPVHEIDHSPSFSAKVKNVHSFSSMQAISIYSIALVSSRETLHSLIDTKPTEYYKDFDDISKYYHKP
jgi:hypothetical protein